MTDKELLDKLDAINRLQNQGYKREKCKDCKGTGVVPAIFPEVGYQCFTCGGNG